MEHTEIVILVLLVAIALLVTLAGLLRVPYPILLVIGGLGMGLIPGMPAVELNPDVVLLIFLPPLLYSSAFFSSLRDLRANLRPISLLAIGLVLLTAAAVALAAHGLIDGMSWAAAFTLGAVVAPTDPLAATAIARRLGAPRRLVAVIEGESLINDGTALVAYRVAIGAAVGGTFSLFEAGGVFVLSAAGGIAIGLMIGWLVAQVRKRLDDPPVEITISLLTAYAAYLPAEELGASGVLAAVTVGIYLGWRAPELIAPSTRIQAYAVWEMLVFVLNGVLFVLIGLQLPTVLDAIAERSATTLALYAAIVCAVVVGVRMAFLLTVPYLTDPRIRAEHRDPTQPRPWRELLAAGWAGMRGAVSLAAALAIPLTTDAGAAFPERDLIVFLTFAVIFFTLVVQGLTLPLLLRGLRICDDGGADREEIHARLRAAEAAIARLDELVENEDWVRPSTAERLRRSYEFRRRRYAVLHEGEDQEDHDYEARSEHYQRLRREVLQAERQELLRLRRAREISDEVLRRVERDLDLEDTRSEL